jgi:hypothetical protein
MLTNWIGVERLNINVHVGFIYKVNNLTTNKSYGGSKFIVNSRTSRYNKSWITYKTSSDYVKNDINQLGIENFKFEILECYDNYHDLKVAEVKLIKQLLYEGNCYNKNIGGRILMDDEVARKIQETFKKNGHPMKGKVHPNKGKHIDSGHRLNKGKRYYNNGVINKIEFPENIDMTIWKEGMIRYQKTPKSVIVKRERKELEYEKNPKHCIVCNKSISYIRRNRKTCTKECYYKSISIHHRDFFIKNGKSFTAADELYITPMGEFKSIGLASVANCVSPPTVGTRCKNNEHIIKYNSRIPKEWCGMTWKELGWSYKKD